SPSSSSSSHLPSHRASPSPTKDRASTTSALHQTIHVVLRPPREVAPPPPRDSHHETNSDTLVAAPERITLHLDRPTDLFGAPGGLGGLGLGTIGIDDVVPLPCPGSLDSGVSEPPFEAPAPQPEAAPTSISPEEVKVYLERLRSFYCELKDSDQLDTAGFVERENLLRPAAEILLADMEATRKKRPAPPPPVEAAAAVAAAAA
ncbi:hypothetical protein PFISCL1PPCAC_9579, partial [Pristionchus fissidentatus]